MLSFTKWMLPFLIKSTISINLNSLLTELYHRITRVVTHCRKVARMHQGMTLSLIQAEAKPLMITCSWKWTGMESSEDILGWWLLEDQLWTTRGDYWTVVLILTRQIHLLIGIWERFSRVVLPEMQVGVWVHLTTITLEQTWWLKASLKERSIILIKRFSLL